MFGFSCAVLDSDIAVLWISVYLWGPFKEGVSGVPPLGKAFLRTTREIIEESLFLSRLLLVWDLNVNEV